MKRKLLPACALGAVLALVAACTAPGAGAPPPQARTFAVTVSDDKMTPDKLVAYEGDTVTIKVTADKDEELHLHGYDYKFELKAKEPQSKTFKADKTGSFEIEIEDTGTHLGELQVLPR